MKYEPQSYQIRYDVGEYVRTGSGQYGQIIDARAVEWNGWPTQYEYRAIDQHGYQVTWIACYLLSATKAEYEHACKMAHSENRIRI